LNIRPFDGRVKRGDIKRVFGNSCNFIHSSEGTLEVAGKVVDFSEGGCTYEEWLQGADPKPLKNLYCPVSWTNQEWKPKWCWDFCGAGQVISTCKKRENGTMYQCWDEYEKAKDQEQEK